MQLQTALKLSNYNLIPARIIITADLSILKKMSLTQPLKILPNQLNYNLTMQSNLLKIAQVLHF